MVMWNACAGYHTCNGSANANLSYKTRREELWAANQKGILPDSV